jgi:UDP-glucose 4-epimerase
MGKVVIFGAGGFVGRNMVNNFQNEGIDFLASDFIDSPFPGSIPYEKVDITAKDQVEKVVEGAETIIHLAASSLTTSLKDPLLDTHINVGGTLNIMESARENDVSFIIYSSASSVVGTLEYNPVDEKHPCIPRTPYAASKLACEHYLRVYQEIYGLDYLVFRFFNIYGPWQYPAGGGLIPSVINRILKDEEITIFGDGSATRDFVLVEDLVSIYRQALERKVTNQTLNMGTGRGTSIMEVVQTASKVMEREPNIDYKPQREGEIDNFYADVSKLESSLGDKPSTSLEIGLERTYEWFRDEGI